MTQMNGASDACMHAGEGEAVQLVRVRDRRRQVLPHEVECARSSRGRAQTERQSARRRIRKRNRRISAVGEFMIDDVGAVRGTDAAAGSEPTVLAVGRLHRKALTLPEAYGLDR